LYHDNTRYLSTWQLSIDARRRARPGGAPVNDAGDPGAGAAQFYIAASTSLLERRPRTLKHGDTFGVFDSYGDIVAGSGAGEGLYHDNTRYLSTWQLSIDARRPLLLSSNVRADNAMLNADLSNPDIFAGDQLLLQRDTLHVLRAKFLWAGACHERLAVKNFGAQRQAVRIGLHFDADFADLFEVRGSVRARRGTRSAARIDARSIALRYRGLDDVVRQATLAFDPAPAHLDERSALYELELEPQQQVTLFARIQCGPATPRAAAFFPALRTARKSLHAGRARAARIDTSHQVFNEVLRRSRADLYMLVTDTPQGPYPYAGIPWFSTAFGRDGLITAMESLWLDPGLALGVLRFLAANQAQVEDPAADAEPGKILHEMRAGEMAALREVPFGKYYGSVDSTPLFVMLAGMYFERTGDVAALRELWPAIEAALTWIDRYGDVDGDGFVEYRKKQASGLDNQGWKDSYDSVFHADGRLATGPIALCEVQGYVYAARHYAAQIARRFGMLERARALELAADALRERFDAAFWCEELGSYAIALDGAKQPCRISTSNAGHLLHAGLLAPARARAVGDTLMGAAHFSGWGIRTVATTAARYNPMSYHNGSVWPHDNALIALGLARYDLTGHVQRLLGALFDAASWMDLRRLPELFCGFRRRAGRGPTSYPVACSPQAWAAATPFALLQATLGLAFHPHTETVSFRHPRLPEFLDEVVLRGLTVGSTRLDVALRRHGGEVSVNVLAKSGPGSVAITL
jgi:glycogen debranching enzyme